MASGVQWHNRVLNFKVLLPTYMTFILFMLNLNIYCTGTWLRGKISDKWITDIDIHNFNLALSLYIYTVLYSVHVYTVYKGICFGTAMTF